MPIIKIFTFLTTLALLANSKVSFAQTTIPQGIVNPAAPKFATPEGFARLVATLWKSAFLIAGILTLAYLVLGGLTWVTAGGDKVNSERARSMMTDAVIGLAVTAASFAIIKFIGNILGIDILNPQFPTTTF